MARARTVSGTYPATFQRASGTSHSQPCVAPVAVCNVGWRATSLQVCFEKGYLGSLREPVEQACNGAIRR